MISKEILIQYADLQQEIKEIRDKIEKLNKEIGNLTKDIERIEEGELVRDKVRGGFGGMQSFRIEGIPLPEYEKKRSDLMVKKLLLDQRKASLETLEFSLLKKTNEVEAFIASVEDSRMRRIISLRVIENFSWNKVADYIGGGNTEDSVKKAFYRFMENT